MKRKEFKEYMDLKPLTDEEIEELLDDKPKKKRKKKSSKTE